MRSVRPAPPALVLGVRSGLVVSVVMVVVGLTGRGTGALAADGPQAAPSLSPAAVQSATEPFSVVPPPDARCEEGDAGRAGSAGWRWHAFIVEAGRDLSTLEFGPAGPGSDYDASDGQITAGLIAGGRGIWNEAPAEQPEGLIDPDGVADVTLDPADYTLTDGRYLIGVACSDDASVTRQWWSIEVTVQTAAAPFLSTDPATVGQGPEATAGAAATSATAVAGDAEQASSTTTAPAGGAAPTSTVAPTGAGTAAPVAGPTGISWAPLVALADASAVLPVGVWAALVGVFGRIAYLISRPVRVHPASST